MSVSASHSSMSTYHSSTYVLLHCNYTQANKARLQESLRSRKNLLELQETSAKEHAAQHKALRAAQAAYSFVGTVAASAATATTASSSKTSLHTTSDSAAAVTAGASGNRWRAAAAADNAFDADEKVKLGLVPTTAAVSYHKQHRSSSSSNSGLKNVDSSSGTKYTADEEYTAGQFAVDDGVDSDQHDADHSSGDSNDKFVTDNAETAVTDSHE
jgi:hypothetical protein